MTTPFEPFKNATLTFLVDDPLAPDTVDSAGNPVPTKQEVTIEAFLKPYNTKFPKVDEFPGLGVNTAYLKGYVTTNDGMTPVGINPGDRTVYAKYRDQEGTFIFTISLQSPVGADAITGDQIVGFFEVLGGQ